MMHLSENIKKYKEKACGPSPESPMAWAPMGPLGSFWLDSDVDLGPHGTLGLFGAVLWTKIESL